MKLAEFFPVSHIVPELEAAEKTAAVRELVKQLIASGAVPKGQATAVERAVMRREELGSTGIGKGVAIPHATHAGVRGVVGAFGRSKKGVDFDALDGQPVYLVFLLLSSPESVEPHLEALRAVTLLVKDEDICSFLRRAKDLTELTELLREAEDRLR